MKRLTLALVLLSAVRSASAATLGDARTALADRRYDQAAAILENLKTDNDDYRLYLLATAHHLAGQHGKAIATLDALLKSHPKSSWRAKALFKRADALMKLGRFKEAREALAWALVLNPRYPAILDKLRAHARELGLGRQPSGLVIRSMARKAGKDVEILFDPSSGAHWLAFAGCKALWIGEPSHRKEMTGSTDRAFSSTEELECFAALLAIYAGERDAGRAKADPSLDRMLRIAEDKLLDVFVLYEITSRVDPQITLRLTKQQRELVRRYVLKYVLSVPDAPPPGRASPNRTKNRGTP